MFHPAGIANATPNASPFVIVTDVDDTVKVTHVNDSLDMVGRFFQPSVSFAGMSSLYRSLLKAANKKGRDYGFAVVSGAPALLTPSIWQFFSDHFFPEPTFVTARPIGRALYGFKYDQVYRLLSQESMIEAEAIFVGDDTESDPDVYQDIKSKVADRMGIQTDIYIRRVMPEDSERISEARDLKDVSFYYFDSAVDIAVIQYLNGNLSDQDFEDVAKEIIQEQDVGRVFVPGEYCPSERSPRLSRDARIKGLPQKLLTRLKEAEAHLRTLCQN